MIMCKVNELTFGQRVIIFAEEGPREIRAFHYEGLYITLVFNDEPQYSWNKIQLHRNDMVEISPFRIASNVFLYTRLT
jgi:hypothetical protein